MTAEIVDFTGITTLDIDSDRILQSAIGKMDQVLLIGWDKDGQEYFASSVSDGGTVLWHMERAKLQLLRKADK